MNAPTTPTLVPEIVPLWKHQREGVLRAIQCGGIFGFLFEPGSGKTLTAITTLRNLFQLHGKPLKTLIICPSIVVDNWCKEIAKFSRLGPMTQPLVGKRQDRIKALDKVGKHIFVTNFEAFDMDDVFWTYSKKNRRIPKSLAFDVLIIDECFHPDTLIDTKDGQKRISEVKEGDYVKNCLGFSMVKSVSVAYPKSVVTVRFNGKSVKCSEGHPWFTQRGWVCASELKEGDLLATTGETMRILQERVCTSEGSQSFLRNILRSEMENVPPGNQREDIYSGDVCQGKCDAYRQERSSEQCTHEEEQPNGHAWGERENFQKVERDRTRPQGTWGEWERSDTGRENSSGCLGSRMAVEPCHSDKAAMEGHRLPDVLQAGSCACWDDALCGSGRQFTQHSEASRAGCQERGFPNFVRVEGVEVHECASDERNPTGAYYDLGIDGHPSFSVSGVLVHNCHRAKNPSAKRTKALIAFRDLQVKHCLVLTGTPILNSAEDVWAQFRILDGGETFGKDFLAFRNEYFVNHNANAPSHVSWPDWKPKRGALELIHDRMKARTMHVKTIDCVDLPPLVKKQIDVPLTTEQRKHYQEMQDDFIISLGRKGEVTAQLAITKLMRLQQILCGFLKTDEGEILTYGANARIDAVVDLLEDLHEQKVIIWTPWEPSYHLLLDAVTKIGRKAELITGLQTKTEKDEVVQRFRFEDTNTVIANPAAAGTGINLTEASTAIWYARTFNLEHRLQGLARNYRGGSNMHRSVTMIDIVAPGTVDEKILLALEAKEDVAGSILEWSAKHLGTN